MFLVKAKSPNRKRVSLFAVVASSEEEAREKILAGYPGWEIKSSFGYISDVALVRL